MANTIEVQGFRLGLFDNGDGTFALKVSGAAGGNAPFSDAAALIKNSIDATKLAILSAVNIPTGTTQTYTLPAAGGSFALGTGAAGQIAFWTGTNSLSGDTNLVWDSINKRLGIGIALPNRPLDIFTTVSGVVDILGFATTADAGKGLLVGIDTTTRYTYWKMNDVGDYGFQVRDHLNNPFLSLTSNASNFFGLTTTALGKPGGGFQKLYIDYANTTIVGAVTINKAAGRVNVAAAATSIVVTNSFVTAASKVFAVISTADGTATIKNVVPAAGSFTITLGASATAQTSIDFFVVNAD